MLHTLNPVLKFDGYWLLADLTGAHNLHQWIRSIAQRAWRAVRQSASLPARREMVVLLAFITIASVYFAYVLAMLGHNIASAAAGAFHSISAAQTLASSALLATCLVMAIGVSLLLARSLTVLARETPDDR